MTGIVPSFPYRRSTDQDAPRPVRHPVIIVGAGPVGLSLAADLALQGVPVLVLDRDDRPATGSRAICFAKHTLEIFDRLGCGQRIVDKGVAWNVGRVFFRDREIYGFDLLPDPGHRRPAFVNLQQYHVEDHLLARCCELPGLEIRWQNTVTDVSPAPESVELVVATPDGPYRVAADYLVACDGYHSTIRDRMGLESRGRVFQDRFLIADVKMHATFPTERWFWFDPPFNPGRSVLVHRQADDVWRIDFQLGPVADPERERRPENILPRVQALLGPATPFELEWASVYTFSCRRMDAFRHGRVLFAGDAAHGVSPFGARGANSGIQDAANLAWKLAYHLSGRAPHTLLDTYATEREAAADENILQSTRATDFITPKDDVSRIFRDAVLDLAARYPFARSLVNSGRLSVPAVLAPSPLSSDEAEESFQGGPSPGHVAPDAPVAIEGRPTWLLDQFRSGVFTILAFGTDESVGPVVTTARTISRRIPVRVVIVRPPRTQHPHASGARDVVDVEGLAASRYDALPGTIYVIRPDQYVCARWRVPSSGQVTRAMLRATFVEE
ncbi:MAG: FAD-dependent oxidoreductase [Betaproteobacteria bacterium]|nr:FAD-dependent oxidoreductase [Betaproteobacteria bacterium]